MKQVEFSWINNSPIFVLKNEGSRVHMSSFLLRTGLPTHLSPMFSSSGPKLQMVWGNIHIFLLSEILYFWFVKFFKLIFYLYQGFYLGEGYAWPHCSQDWGKILTESFYYRLIHHRPIESFRLKQVKNLTKLLFSFFLWVFDFREEILWELQVMGSHLICKLVLSTESLFFRSCFAEGSLTILCELLVMGSPFIF